MVRILFNNPNIYVLSTELKRDYMDEEILPDELVPQLNELVPKKMVIKYLAEIRAF